MRTWLLNLFRRRPAPPTAAETACMEMKAMLDRMAARLRHYEEFSAHAAALMEHTAPAPEEAPEWTAEDRGALLNYLRSPSGRVLLVTLRVQEEILKAAACSDTEKRVDHARGQAVGYRKGIASLIVLSAPPPPKEETADTPDRGADELRDQLSHT